MFFPFVSRCIRSNRVLTLLVFNTSVMTKTTISITAILKTYTVFLFTAAEDPVAWVLEVVLWPHDHVDGHLVLFVKADTDGSQQVPAAEVGPLSKKNRQWFASLSAGPTTSRIRCKQATL